MKGDVAKEFERLLLEKCERMEVKILDLSFQHDHVHLFIYTPLRYSPSQLIYGTILKNVRIEFSTIFIKNVI